MEQNSKNDPKKPIFSKFRKTKKCVSSSCPKDPSVQKLASQIKSCALQVDRRTDRQTDTKVKTEDTLSGFLIFFKFSFNLSSRSGPTIQWTSTTRSCSGLLPTHNIKRHLVPGVVYSSSSSLQLPRDQIQFQIFLVKDICLDLQSC